MRLHGFARLNMDLNCKIKSLGDLADKVISIDWMFLI